jgi:hypothetical protein
MPPPAKSATAKPRPTRAEQAPVVAWIHHALLQTHEGVELEFPDKGNLVPHELLFGPLAADAPPPASPPRLWRISPYQYQALIAAVGTFPIVHAAARHAIHVLADPQFFPRFRIDRDK